MACDVSEKKLEECKKIYGIPNKKLINDYKTVINSSNIDAVHICTPNETHYNICKEALLSGKHVLIEKPMTTDAKQAYELVDLATSENLVLQVGLIYRFNNALKKIKELIQQKYFGNIFYVKLRWTTLMPSPINRDIIFDLVPHPLDILNYLFEKWPTKITCKAKSYRRKELEEVAYIIAEFNENLMANIEVSWLQPEKIREISIIGSARCATVDCLNQVIQIYENEENKAFTLENEANNTIKTELNHFIDCIQNKQKSSNSGLIGAINVGMLEYIKKSLHEGRTIEVPKIEK